jgi:hypothetical protein
MWNSFRDSRDITVKTAADLAKTRKGQVALTAFHSTKITSIQTAPAGKVFLAPT